MLSLLKKTWLWVTVLSVVVGAAGWFGYTFMTVWNDKDIKKEIAEKAGKPKETETDKVAENEEGEDVSKEVVNDPVEESVVVFKDQSQFENGHDFIQYFHNFYNDTLCWGKVETADYNEQKEQAGVILNLLQQAEVKNEDLKSDFASISEYADIVTKSDDREAMVKLHRYFHDLDIYFNGYSYNETFQITEFNG